MPRKEQDDLGMKIDKGIKVAVAEALERHRKLGESIAVWRDEKIVILRGEEISFTPTKLDPELGILNSEFYPGSKLMVDRIPTMNEERIPNNEPEVRFKATIQRLEDLECSMRARELRKRISILCNGLPKEETYCLKDQILRSSRSVPANIAEGYGRHHHQENLQFCRQARGSRTETMEHLNCALDEQYIDPDSSRKRRIPRWLRRRCSEGITPAF